MSIKKLVQCLLAPDNKWQNQVEYQDPQLHSAAVSKVVAAKSLYKPAAKVAHKSRTCRKCAMESCSGKKEVKYCSNPC